MNAITISQPSPPNVKAVDTLTALAMLYHRHDDTARALVLGMMALRHGHSKPSTCLMIASCFLKTGDADQALAALERLEDDTALTDDEASAKRFLSAKAHFRQGRADVARVLLTGATDHDGTEPPTTGSQNMRSVKNRKTDL